jgi:outer membrane protein assembly factor BamB
VPGTPTVRQPDNRRTLDVDFRADITRSGQTPSLAVLPTLRPPYRLDNGSDTPSLAVVPSLHPTYVRTPDGRYEPQYRLGNGADTPSLAVVPSMAFVGDLRFAGLKQKPLTRVWEFNASLRLEAAPLVTPEYLFLASTDRTAFALGKEDRKLIYELQADTPISAPPGQYGEVAYVPSMDSTVYAVNIILGRALWRFNAGGRLDRRPVVTDEEVFTYGERSKIARLNRDTGELFWQAAVATDVRAVSPKFVYASDRTDRLFILDRRTGSRVTEYDTRGFNVPVVNTQDDRLYLASHNGTVLCLHDRDVVNPVPLRPGEPKAAPPAAKKGGEAPPPKR